MSFTPQPYPLFAAFYEGSTATTARIIGWVAPDGENIAPSNIRPVVLPKLHAGDVAEPRYLNLEDDAHWFGDTEMDALAQLHHAEDTIR